MARLIRPLEQRPSEVDATRLPPSKSHVQRAVVLAGLGARGARIVGGGAGEDVEAAVATITALGAAVRTDADDLLVTPGPLPSGRVSLQCAGSATTARIVGAVAACLGLHVRIDGDPSLRRRPFEALAAVVSAVGGLVRGRSLPLELDARGASWGERVEVDASTTSQIASGLVLGAVLRRARSHGARPAEVLARGVAAPGYLEVTAEVARAFGHEVEVAALGDDVLVTVGAAAGPAPVLRWTPPADASAFALPVALGAMLGVPVVESPRGDRHPDWEVATDAARIATARPGDVVRLELGARPDTFPALAALAATRTVTVELVGAPALRAKESDRIRAMAEGLRACGVAHVAERADGLVVRGPVGAADAAVAVEPPPDHRVVMALALLGAVRPGGMRIESDAAVAKSWPGFWSWLERYAELGPGSDLGAIGEDRAE